MSYGIKLADGGGSARKSKDHSAPCDVKPPALVSLPGPIESLHRHHFPASRLISELDVLVG